MEESTKANGTRNALNSMLFYYIYSLKEMGYENPKQIVSEEIGKMISLADEQTQFVIKDAKSNGKLSESVMMAIQLIEGMESDQKFDKETFSIIKNVLIAVNDSFKQRRDDDDTRRT